MSNDKTSIKVSWYDNTKVDRFNRTVRLHQHFDEVAYTPAEARSLAAALVRHADNIDPPDDSYYRSSVKLDADDIRRGAKAIAEAMGVPSEPMIRVTEDDEPEVAGYLVESGDNLPEPAYFDAAGEAGARDLAAAYEGTVRELHLGPVIHDGPGPKQCAHGVGTPSQCDRNQHADSIHVALTWEGELDTWWSDLSDGELTDKTDLADAAIAAVRDRDEREGL